MKIRLFVVLVILGLATACGPEPEKKEPLTCRPWGKDAPDRVRREIDAVASSDAALLSYRKFWEDYSSRFAGPFTTEAGRYEWDGTRWVRVSETSQNSHFEFIINDVGILIADPGDDYSSRSRLVVKTENFDFELVHNQSRQFWVFNLSDAWESYDSYEIILHRDTTPISYRSRNFENSRAYGADFENFHLQAAFLTGQVGGPEGVRIEFNGRKTSMSSDEARRECPGIEEELSAMLPNPNEFVDITAPQEVLRFIQRETLP